MNLINSIVSDKKVRIATSKKSHYIFFHTYFGHYVEHATAPFQKEMFLITEDDSIKTAVVVAFRGSAKSTIMTMSYPIWAIIGKPQKKLVLLLSQTQYQAKLHLTNLKRELESNDMLRSELGPFQENDEWGSGSLVIPRFNARIITASCEQSIRGLRHGPHRPDLIICDDVEDLSSVKTKEGRDKTYSWLTSEVIPTGDKNTKIIIIGNLLHEDSLLMWLKNSIEAKKLNGIFKSYPIIDNNKILWPGKFKAEKDIENLKQSMGNEISWQREFMLRIISDDGQLIYPEWIHYYDDLPGSERTEYRYTGVGVDLAISQKNTADYTAMVSANIYGWNKKMKIYIQPNSVNERLTFPQTVDKIKLISKTIGYKRPNIYIEDVGYQASLIQHLNNEGVRVEGSKTHGQDKRTRLALTTEFIHSGKILFPQKGAEQLIAQLTGFGVEKYDDLADAFSILILKIMEKRKASPEIFIIRQSYDND